MPREKRVIPTIISTVIFICMEAAALLMLSGSSSLQDIWLSRMSHKFLAKAWGSTQSVKRYFNLNKENAALAEDNYYLTLRLKELEGVRDGSRQDSLTAAVPTVDGFRYTGAAIVKISRNKQHNYLILNKGSEDGVNPHCGVVSSHGVIGIIDAVDRHYSYALSFMNSEVSVSARLSDEGAVGPLVWDGHSSKGAILKEIPLQYRFEKGDTVYTSGFSSIFPPGIPLGTAGESKVVNGATNEIKIDLFQDYSALRFVTIVENTGREEISRLEAEAEQ